MKDIIQNQQQNTNNKIPLSLAETKLVNRLSTVLEKNQFTTGEDQAVFDNTTSVILSAIIRKTGLLGNFFIRKTNNISETIKRRGIYYPGTANRDGSGTYDPGTAISKDLRIDINTSLQNPVEFSEDDISSVDGSVSTAVSIIGGQTEGYQLSFDRFLMTKIKQRSIVANDNGQGAKIYLGATPDLQTKYEALKTAINSLTKVSNLDFSVSGGKYSGDIHFVQRQNIVVHVETDLFDYIIEQERDKFTPLISGFDYQAFRWKGGTLVIEREDVVNTPETFNADGLPNEATPAPSSFLIIGEINKNLFAWIKQHQTFAGNRPGQASTRIKVVNPEVNLNGDLAYPELIINGAIEAAPPRVEEELKEVGLKSGDSVENQIKFNFDKKYLSQRKDKKELKLKEQKNKLITQLSEQELADLKAKIESNLKEQNDFLQEKIDKATEEIKELRTSISEKKTKAKKIKS